MQKDGKGVIRREHPVRKSTPALRDFGAISLLCRGYGRESGGLGIKKGSAEYCNNAFQAPVEYKGWKPSHGLWKRRRSVDN